MIYDVLEGMGKMRFKLLLGILTMTCMVGGCAGIPAVITQFTPYHTLSIDDLGKTIAIVPATADQAGQLEFQTFRMKMEGRLSAVGFRVVQEPKDADLIAVFTYGVDNGVTTTQVGSVPIYGQTSPGIYTTTLSVPPTYGLVGSSTYSENITTFKRTLALDILDGKGFLSGSPKKVYEARLSSQGRCGQLASVIEPIITALFQGFPGESGKPLKVSVPSDIGKRC